ncbi:unnamed protein product [Natator depressus]
MKGCCVTYTCRVMNECAGRQYSMTVINRYNARRQRNLMQNVSLIAGAQQAQTHPPFLLQPYSTSQPSGWEQSKMVDLNPLNNKDKQFYLEQSGGEIVSTDRILRRMELL